MARSHPAHVSLKHNVQLSVTLHVSLSERYPNPPKPHQKIGPTPMPIPAPYVLPKMVRHLRRIAPAGCHAGMAHVPQCTACHGPCTIPRPHKTAVGPHTPYPKNARPPLRDPRPSSPFQRSSAPATTSPLLVTLDRPVRTENQALTQAGDGTISDGALVTSRSCREDSCSTTCEGAHRSGVPRRGQGRGGGRTTGRSPGLSGPFLFWLDLSISRGTPQLCP